MARNNDFGDQFPGDSDDQVPNDPLTGLTELDYDPGLVTKAKSFQGRSREQFIPDLGLENKEPVERDSWSGIVIEVLGNNHNTSTTWPRLYNVLRQDGLVIQGILIEVVDRQILEVGSPVTVNRGTIENEYIIVGSTRPKELSFLDLTALGSVTSTVPFNVNYNFINSEGPLDDLFLEKGEKGDFKVKMDGSIEITGEEEFTVEVDWGVTLNTTDNPAETISAVYTQTGCWTFREMVDATQTAKWIKSPKTWFNEQNGFRLHYDPEDCTSNISLFCEKPDMLLNQQWPLNQNNVVDPLAWPFWTDEPKIGNSIQVGTRVQNPWVKIGNESEHLWITKGGFGGRLKLKFPAGPPCGSTSSHSVGQAKGFTGFLYAKSVFGECVRLGWRKPGKTGSFKVLSCDIDHYDYCYTYIPGVEEPQSCPEPVHACYTLEFQNGLFMGSGSQFDKDSEQPSFTFCCWKDPDPFDPCGQLKDPSPGLKCTFSTCQTLSGGLGNPQEN